MYSQLSRPISFVCVCSVCSVFTFSVCAAVATPLLALLLLLTLNVRVCGCFLQHTATQRCGDAPFDIAASVDPQCVCVYSASFFCCRVMATPLSTLLYAYASFHKYGLFKYVSFQMCLFSNVSFQMCLMCLFSNVSLFKCVSFQMCLFSNMSLFKCVSFQMCLFSNMSLFKCVSFQTCLFSNMSLSKYVSFKMCLFPNMSLYKYRAISWRHHFRRCCLCCASIPLFTYTATSKYAFDFQIFTTTTLLPLLCKYAPFHIWSVLQCVAVCCSVLQCVAVCYSVLKCARYCLCCASMPLFTYGATSKYVVVVEYIATSTLLSNI